MNVKGNFEQDTPEPKIHFTGVGTVRSNISRIIRHRDAETRNILEQKRDKVVQ